MGTEEPQASPASSEQDPAPEAPRDSEDWLLTDEEIALATEAVRLYREGQWPTPPEIRGQHT